jgi:hypothetical protein
MNAGLAGANALLSIPISPNAFFFAVRNDQLVKRISAMDANKIVQIVNTGVVLQAIKYVYGVDDSQLLFVAKRLGKKCRRQPYRHMRKE